MIANRKCPYYRQLDQMDSGPTCLRMVAKHYGCSCTIQSLREKSQTGQEGVSLLGISEAAKTTGFRTMGVKIPFEKFAAEASLPCVVHWDQNHFVVVYAIKGANSGWMSRVKETATCHPSMCLLIRYSPNRSFIISEWPIRMLMSPPANYCQCRY